LAKNIKSPLDGRKVLLAISHVIDVDDTPVQGPISNISLLEF